MNAQNTTHPMIRPVAKALSLPLVRLLYLILVVIAASSFYQSDCLMFGPEQIVGALNCGYHDDGGFYYTNPPRHAFPPYPLYTSDCCVDLVFRPGLRIIALAFLTLPHRIQEKSASTAARLFLCRNFHRNRKWNPRVNIPAGCRTLEECQRFSFPGRI